VSGGSAWRGGGLIHPRTSRFQRIEGMGLGELLMEVVAQAVGVEALFVFNRW